MHELLGFTLFLAIILIPIALGVLEWRFKNKLLKAILAIVLLFGGYQCVWNLKDMERSFWEYHYNLDVGRTLYEIKAALEEGNQAELLGLLESKGQGDLFYSPETEDIRDLLSEIQKLNEISGQISE